MKIGCGIASESWIYLLLKIQLRPSGRNHAVAGVARPVRVVRQRSQEPTTHPYLRLLLSFGFGSGFDLGPDGTMQPSDDVRLQRGR